MYIIMFWSTRLHLHCRHHCRLISISMATPQVMRLLAFGLILLELVCLRTAGLVELNATFPQSPTFPLSAKNITKKSRQDEVDILPPHYYRDVAPMIDGRPVKVTVSVVILNIKLSSGSSQAFDADIFYHNYWTDHRLQKPSNEEAIAQRINLSAQESLPQYKLSDSWKKRLWIPDTYFRNAIEGSVSNILTPTYYFTITNYTEVFMAVRLSLKLSCEMNFAKFPFDSQKCFINITMTSEDINTVMLDWDMFRVGSHVDVTEFEITKIDRKSCSKYLDIGIFSCLYGELNFRRNIGNYMIKRIIPSFIIVVMTFMGFWIPTTVSPARTSLPITALLALITQQIQSDLSVSYVYALQVWNIVCIVFVFCNLLEFAIALYVMHMTQKRKGKNKKKDDIRQKDEPTVISMPHKDTESTRPVEPTVWQRVKTRLRTHFATTTRHSSVDLISRYVFPTTFFLFVFVFAIWVSV